MSVKFHHLEEWHSLVCIRNTLKKLRNILILRSSKHRHQLSWKYIIAVVLMISDHTFILKCHTWTEISVFIRGKFITLRFIFDVDKTFYNCATSLSSIYYPFYCFQDGIYARSNVTSVIILSLQGNVIASYKGRSCF